MIATEATHYGRAEVIRDRRSQTLAVAFAAHPERFVNRPPAPPVLPTAAWINKPTSTEEVSH